MRHLEPLVGENGSGKFLPLTGRTIGSRNRRSRRSPSFLVLIIVFFSALSRICFTNFRSGALTAQRRRPEELNRRIESYPGLFSPIPFFLLPMVLLCDRLYRSADAESAEGGAKS